MISLCPFLKNQAESNLLYLGHSGRTADSPTDELQVNATSSNSCSTQSVCLSACILSQTCHKLQDALSDVGSTVQKYSQKASRLIGSKAASPGPQPALSDGRYEPSVGLNDDDQELDSDSKLPSRDSTKGEKASISQTP